MGDRHIQGRWCKVISMSELEAKNSNREIS